MNSHESRVPRVELRESQVKQDALDAEKKAKETMFAGADYGAGDTPVSYCASKPDLPVERQNRPCSPRNGY